MTTYKLSDMMDNPSSGFVSGDDNCLKRNELHVPTGIGEVPGCEQNGIFSIRTGYQFTDEVDTLDADSPACHLVDKRRWFVMRDLKRANAKLPAYRMLRDAGIEVFTPMKWHVVMRLGRKVREEVPFIRDLFFVHCSRLRLDPIVTSTPTLQYRYFKGGRYLEPAVVSDRAMDTFIKAVATVESPVYYSPDELTPGMIGRRVRIVGGPLDGREARLLNLRGSRKKRIIVEIPSVIVAAVEISPDYIHFV